MRWYKAYIIFLFIRLTLYFCGKAWSLHVNVCSLLAGPDFFSPFVWDFCVLGRLAFKNCIAQSQGIWVHVALSFQKFLRRGGGKVQIVYFPLFFSEKYHLAFTKKESEVSAWDWGQCSPWYIFSLQSVYVYSKEWVHYSSKKPKSINICRTDEQIANRIQQCKVVVVTDPWRFTVAL